MAPSRVQDTGGLNGALWRRRAGVALLTSVACLAANVSVAAADISEGTVAGARHGSSAPAVARPTTPVAGGRLVAHIYDARTERPLAARVRLVNLATGAASHARSDASGLIRLPATPLPGDQADDRYRLTSRAQGHFAGSQTVRVPAGGTQRLSVRLVARTVTIRGTLRSPRSTSHATVTVVGEATGDRVRVAVRRDGSFRAVAPAAVAPTASRLYRVTAEVGSARASTLASVAPGETRVVRLDAIRSQPRRAPASAQPLTAEAFAPTQVPACPQGATTWVGPASGSWETAANWSPAVVPTSGTYACIPAGDGPVIVAAADSVAGLRLGSAASLAISSGSLSLTDGTTPSALLGALSVASGAGLSVAAGVTLINGTDGSITNSADGVSGTNAQTGLPKSVAISGTFEQDAGTIAAGAGDFPVYLRDGASLHIGGTGAGAFMVVDLASAAVSMSGDLATGQSLDIPGLDLCQGSGTTTVTSSGSFTNAGTIKLDHVGACGTATAALTIGGGGTLTNSGHLDVASAAFSLTRTITGAVTNTGVVDVGPGAQATNLVVASGSSWLNEGTVTVADPSQLQVASGATFTNGAGGIVTNHTVGTQGGGNGLFRGFVVAGTFAQDAGSVTSGAGTFPVYLRDGSSIVFGGTGPGEFTVLDNSNAAVALSGDLSAGQTLDVSGVDICQGSGTTTVTSSGGFTNAGTINIKHIGGCGTSIAALVVGGGGTLTNTGTVNVSGIGLSPAVGRSLKGAVVNNGAFNVGVQGSPVVTFTLAPGSSLLNQGTLTIRSGNAMVVAAGVAASGGDPAVPAATITNAAGGTIVQHGNAVGSAGTGLLVRGAFTQDAGSVTGEFPVYVQNGSAMHFGGTGPGAFMAFDIGTTAVALTGNLAAGQTFDAAAVNTCQLDGVTTVTTPGSFASAGHLVLDHAGGCANAQTTLVVGSGGTLTNSGTLTVSTNAHASLTGALVETSSGVFSTDVRSGPSGAVLAVSGPVTLAGTIDFVTTPPPPSQGAHYILLSDTSQTGTFSDATGLSAGGGLGYDVMLDPTDVAATVVSVTAFPFAVAISPTSGPTGTTVTVFGSGLTGATAVTFGGTPGTSLAVAGDGELTVVAPAGTGTVDIRVTTPGGTSSVVAPPTFTYAATPSGGTNSAELDVTVRNAGGTPVPGVVVAVTNPQNRNPLGAITTNGSGLGVVHGLRTGQTIEVAIAASVAPYGAATAVYQLAAGVNNRTLTVPVQPLISSAPTELAPDGDAAAVWPGVVPSPNSPVDGGSLGADTVLADVRFTLHYTSGDVVLLASDAAGTMPFCVDGSWTVTLTGPAPASTPVTLTGSGCPAAGGVIDLGSAAGLVTGTYGGDVRISAAAGASHLGSTDIYLLPSAVGEVTDLRAAPEGIVAPAQFNGELIMKVGERQTLNVLLGGSPLPGAVGYHAVFGFDPAGIAVRGLGFPAGWSGNTRDNFVHGDGGLQETTSSSSVPAGHTILKVDVTCRQKGTWPISFSGNYWLPAFSAGYAAAVQGAPDVVCNAPHTSPQAAPLGVSINPATGAVTVSLNASGMGSATNAQLVTGTGAVVRSSTSLSADPSGALVTATFPATPPGKYGMRVRNATTTLVTTTGTPLLVSPALPLFSVHEVDVVDNVPGIATTHIWNVTNEGTLDGVAVFAFGFPSYLTAEPALDTAALPAGGRLLLHGQLASGNWAEYVALPVSAGAAVNVAWTITVPPCAVFGSPAVPNCPAGDPPAPAGKAVPIIPTLAGQYTAPEWATVSGQPSKALVDAALGTGMNDYTNAFKAILAMSPAKNQAYMAALPNQEMVDAMTSVGASVLETTADHAIEATHQRTVAAPAPPGDVPAPPPSTATPQAADALGDPAASSFAAFQFNSAEALAAGYGAHNQGPSADGRAFGLRLSHAGGVTPVETFAGAATTYAGGRVAPVVVVPTSASAGSPQAGMDANWQPQLNSVDVSSWTAAVTSTLSMTQGTGALHAAALPSIERADGQTSITTHVYSSVPVGQAPHRGLRPLRSDGTDEYFHTDVAAPVRDGWSIVSNAMPSVGGLIVETGLAVLGLTFLGASFPATVVLTLGGIVLTGFAQMILQYTTGLGVQDSVVRNRHVVTSEDPNAITADPQGAGAAGWITRRPITYTIQFENEAAATAAAHDVVVTLPLDPDLDPATVQPGDSSFPGVQFALNHDTHVMTWTFPKIDLPPNTAPPGGQAWVSFTATPRSSAPHGATIDEQATVFFDYNPPLATSVSTNTLDITPPAATLDPLPATRPAGPVSVSWQTASQVGIAYSVVYLSVDGGPFKPAGQSDTSSATIEAPAGHTYGVAVQAVDLAGLSGPVPTVAQDSFKAIARKSTTTLTLSTAKTTYGHEDVEKFTVSVASTATDKPSGKVAVRVGKSTVCTAKLTAGRGVCKLSATRLAAGKASLVAVYLGDKEFGPSTSTKHSLTVAREPTTTTLGVTPSTVHVGHEQAAKLTVHVTPRFGGTMAGKVVITAGSVTLCTVTLHRGSGTCSPGRSALPVGHYNLTARFASANGQPSVSARKPLVVTR